MNASPRICRAMVESIFGPPILTERQRLRQEKILAAAVHLMAHFGHAAITARILAAALRITTAALAWHFTDTDALLGEILNQHLATITGALAEIPHDAPNRQALLRAAYLTATRTASGQLTPTQILLTRDRHLLPLDVLIPLEQSFQTLGETLAGDLGPQALDLLSLPWVTAETAEPLLAALNAQNQAEPATQKQPAKPPAPRPPPPQTTTLAPAHTNQLPRMPTYAGLPGAMSGPGREQRAA